ncbi:MAG: short-chain dehydrogenase/reductase [Actinomycetia bacterium]|jgi:NAD(P)-dependent dehydrogenase (short-subunit alcohol dehydrogenase family)|nr:short-chain dehydrogenase/reductase [Actinomycetes bacterium]
MELKNKVALITGATAGIGREAAKLLAAEGAEIIVTGRHAERGATTARAIIESGGEARFVKADLADPASLRQLAQETGEVDILVNNAAAFPMGPALSVGMEAFDAALATNIRAPYFLTAALAPAMIAKGSGSIVNITTMAAYIGMPGTSAYGATKAALSSLTRTWAAEFSTAGVRVNTVSPGPTRTDTVVAAMGDAAAAQVGKTTLLRRQASPREIAEVILFLASDRSSYITGATIAVDAGRTAI